MNENGNDEGRIGRTWNRVTGEIAAFSGGLWAHVWSNLTEWAPKIARTIVPSMEDMDPELKAEFEARSAAFFRSEAPIPQELEKAIEKAEELPWPGNWIVTIYLRTYGPVLLIKEKLRLSLLPMAFSAAQDTTSDIPPVEVLVREFLRSPDNQTLITDFLEKHNYGSLAQSVLLASAQNYGDLNSIFTLRNRGHIPSDGIAIERIQKLGFSETNATQLLELRNVIPALPDIIRMAVREAFDVDAIERFKLDEAYPALLTEWAGKQGLSEEWAKSFWRAHWNLPSVTQGYEMLWRTKFTEDDLDLLMRVADINPYFRPFLKEIAYHPYTRVDARRMEKLGILDRDGVKRAYLDLGYNEEKAEGMTEFTMRYNTQSQLSTVIARIKHWRRDGVYDSLTAYQRFLMAGLTTKEAKFELLGIDMDIAVELETDQLNHIKTLFTSKRIDLNTCSDMLDTFGIAAEGKAELIELWSEKRLVKARYPSKSDLEKYMLAGVISQEEYTEEMEQLGFSGKYIQWHIDYLTKELGG